MSSRRLLSAIAAAAATWTALQVAASSPNVPLEHPAYEELARLEALGNVLDDTGGFAPLTERHMSDLLLHAEVAWRVPRGLWFRPLERLRAVATKSNDDLRPYSTLARPRDMVGALSISCEHREANACGAGQRFTTLFDASMGYSEWISASIRLREQAQTSGDALETGVDRAYVVGEIGPAAIEVGRDILVFGPQSHTQLGWGTNAPPLDHVRLSTSEPYELTPSTHLSAQYVVGVLRPPQRFPGNLVTIAHAQLSVGRSVQFGLIQLLQLGGDGTPHLGFWDFLAEHVRRKDTSATATDSSNRRFGGDASFRISSLAGARFYYSLVFEDIRKARFVDALRYDADHLIGVELAAIGPGRRHGLTFEWHETGIRSQENSARTTGFTSGAFAVGSPLGPDATSLYLSARIDLRSLILFPWIEAASLGSDGYEFIVDGPINPVKEGPSERRYRLGAKVRVPINKAMWAECDAFVERVTNYAFQSGVDRNHAGITASIVWYPNGRLGTVGLN